MNNPATLPLVTGPYCNGCIAQKTGVRRLGMSGLGTSGLMIVGDSPWVQEIAAGENFAGASGFYLNKQLERVGLSRQEVTVVNAMACKPPHLGWTDNPERFPDAFRAIKQCSPYLDAAIRERQPKCFVALGDVALRRLTDADGVLTNHSYVHETSYGIPCIPTFHPSHIIQGNHKLTYAFLHALLRARNIIQGTFERDKFELILDPSPEEMRRYIARAGERIKYLMIDIETAHSASLGEDEATTDNTSIVRFSISVEMGKSGLTVPWAEPYIGILQDAINRSDWQLYYNKNFDVPRLRLYGLTLHDRIIDVMNLWHWFQSDLPKALAFSAPFYYRGAPWKHLSYSNPDYYSAMDAAVQGLVFLGAWADVEKEGRLDRFMRHCVKVSPIMFRMGQAGVKIDVEAKGTFFTAIDQDLKSRNEVIQAAVPDAVKPVKEWRRAPKDMTGVNVEYAPVEDGLFEDKRPVRYWKQLQYNPRSSDQTIELLKTLGIKPPKKRDGKVDPETGEVGETADAKVLRKHMGKFPIFAQILAYRQAATMKSTFNWPLRPDGRVGTLYNFNPSTWRKGSSNQNLMNIPKREALSDAFRKMIVASPGHVLMEGDSSAIEAVLVGIWAGSKDIVRLAKAGIHGWVTAAWNGHPIPLDLPFAELQRRCKEAKYADEVSYERNKRVIHLCMTGEHEVLTPQGWVRLDKYKGQPVAQWSKDNGRMDFVIPSAFITQEFDGTLESFEGQSLSQLVTPNHAIPTVHTSGDYKSIKRTEASQVNSSSYIPVSGSLDGFLEMNELSIRLAVLTQADGSIVGRRIKVALTRARKIERLKQLLTGKAFKERRYGNRTIITFPVSYLGEAKRLLTISKEFSTDVILLTSQGKHVFLNELPYWDGSVQETETSRRVQYMTASEGNAMIVQTVAATCNAQGLMRHITVDGRKYYVVSLNKRRFAYSRPITRQRINFIGLVYCLTVPSGFFLVRRNNRISVTGNSNYKGTAQRVMEEYPDIFPTLKDATDLQQFYLKTKPGQDVLKWHEQVITRAAKDKFLVNHFNYKHYFYEVMHFDQRTYSAWMRRGKGKDEATRAAWKLGDDAKRAIAFLPQSDASAIQTEILLRLVEYEMVMEWLRLIIHDSIVLEVPEARADWMAQVLNTEMTRHVPEIDESIGCEIKYGYNLGKWNAQTNPNGMKEVKFAITA